jgi:SAM-dependent methyltransferase
MTPPANVMHKTPPTLAEVQDYWDANPAGQAEVQHLAYDRLSFFDERDRQTQCLYPHLDQHYGFARARGRLTLELGCGMGYNAQRLAACGARLVAMDLAPNAVRLTRERFSLRGLKAGFVVADAEHLPFAAGAFEAVFSSGVIHHSPDTRAAAQEIVRVLAPGGVSTVMVYHRDSVWFWWNIVLVLGSLMWLLNSLPGSWRESILGRRPHWRHLVLPLGHTLTFDDVVRAGTDFGGLQNPISRVFTRRSARALFRGLTRFRFSTNFNRFRALDLSPSLATRLVRAVLAWLDDRAGWFLIVHAEKPDRP